MALRSRNAALLFKIEAQEGVPETPSAATDAVLVENPRVSFDPQNTQTREVTGSLDNRGPIVGGLQMSMTFDVYLKGSGVAGTPPEFGELLRACGWAEVVTAASIPAAPEAAAAGSATTLTLGASAAGTGQLYRGMPILLGGNPAAGVGFIVDYSAAKLATLADSFDPALDATTTWQIPVNVLYRPASAAIPSGTFNLFMDGLQYVMTGARGDFTLAAPAGGPGRLSFTFRGMFVSKGDVAVPAATYDATRPPIFKNGRMLVARAQAAIATLGFANGNSLVYPPNPNAGEGFDPSIITERAMTGSLDPQATLVATRDILAAMRAGSEQIVHARWGSVAGNRIGLTMPAALYTGNNPGDRDGLLTEETAFACIGQDAGAFLAFW